VILLDTCVLIWLADDQDKLSEPARKAMRANVGGLFVSSATAFEISLKWAIGRLKLPGDGEVWYRDALRLHGLKEIPLDGRCAALAGRLPFLHRDPCDRFIIATAGIHRMPIVTPDPIIRRYPDVRVIW